MSRRITFAQSLQLHSQSTVFRQGLVGLGETPGRWSPEPFPTLATKKPAEAEEEEAEKQPPPPPARFSPRWCAATGRDFTSAHKFPPFRWLFITNAFNACYSQIATLFFIYWCATQQCASPRAMPFSLSFAVLSIAILTRRFQDEVGGPGARF